MSTVISDGGARRSFASIPLAAGVGAIDAGVTAIFLLYTFIPMASVLLFSLAGKWTTTILPEAWSLQAYRDILAHPEFLPALGRSCLVGILAMLIDVVVVTMALLGAALMRKGRMVGVMEWLSIIPVALPGVVLALGCILFYGRFFPALLGRPVLLVFMEAGFGLPLAFWIMRNAFRATDVKTLYAAARILGAPMRTFMWRILLPCVGKGALAAAIMVFTTAFNNFALAQLLVGAGWKTMPLLQNTVIHVDGHQASAMAIVGIAVTFVMSLAACLVNRNAIAKSA